MHGTLAPSASEHDFSQWSQAYSQYSSKPTGYSPFQVPPIAKPAFEQKLIQAVERLTKAVEEKKLISDELKIWLPPSPAEDVS